MIYALYYNNVDEAGKDDEYSQNVKLFQNKPTLEEVVQWLNRLEQPKGWQIDIASEILNQGGCNDCYLEEVL